MFIEKKTYFENEEQIPWKHHFDCECDNCNSYFFEINASPFGMKFQPEL